MKRALAKQILDGFNVEESERRHLVRLLTSKSTPQDAIKDIIEQSIQLDNDVWDMRVADLVKGTWSHSTSIRKRDGVQNWRGLFPHKPNEVAKLTVNDEVTEPGMGAEPIGDEPGEGPDLTTKRKRRKNKIKKLKRRRPSRAAAGVKAPYWTQIDSDVDGADEVDNGAHLPMTGDGSGGVRFEKPHWEASPKDCQGFSHDTDNEGHVEVTSGKDVERRYHNKASPKAKCAAAVQEDHRQREEAEETTEQREVNMHLQREAQQHHPGPKRAASERCSEGRKSYFFASPSPPPTTPRTRTASATCSKLLSQLTPVRMPRPPPGTLSCLPFPALDAPYFGLIQEETAHDPFALLVAVTLLIKTRGTQAIPTFRTFIERWPTPEALADVPESKVQMLIRHLGFGTKRARSLKRLAETWIATHPPMKGRKYMVRGYEAPEGWQSDNDEELGGKNGYWDRRDVLHQTAESSDDSDFGDADARYNEPQQPQSMSRGRRPSEKKTKRRKRPQSAWEIGHLTQGRYAIDSWRIFCRDKLLGRPGPGIDPFAAGEGFQPEWMRVLPRDKELRAYLRWRWMQEGWEWDARTGEREALRHDVYRAVMAGKATWDADGNIHIDGAGPAAKSQTMSSPRCKISWTASEEPT